MADFRTWLVAFRLRTLPLAIACIGMGSFLAADVGRFSWMICFLCVFTTICLQILSNLANDYGDSIHGADSIERKGPKRTVQSGQISSQAMLNAIILFAILSFGLGISLLFWALQSWKDFGVFLGLGILSIIAAITYTAGKRPYGYAGLGDISVFIFFGWVGVMGTYYLYTKEWNGWILFPASSCGLFATAVLNINNIRDIHSDQKAGKKSIPVRIGRANAVKYHIALLLSGFVCALIYTILNFTNWIQFLFLLILPLLIRNIRAVQTQKASEQLDPFLKQMAISTLFFVLTFGIGLLLG